MGDFGWILGFEEASNFEAEVGRRKSDFKAVKGSRYLGQSALITIVDQSIVGIVDRWSLESLIVGRWNR